MKRKGVGRPDWRENVSATTDVSGGGNDLVGHEDDDDERVLGGADELGVFLSTDVCLFQSRRGDIRDEHRTEWSGS